MKQGFRLGALVAAWSLCGHVLAQPSPDVASVEVELSRLVQTPRLRDARLGIIVMDAATSRVIFEHGADVSLNPASNAKLLTAAAALSILGPSHRFTTSVEGSLDANGSTPRLVLRGDGDPSLRTSDLFELARQAWSRGLRRVDGEIVVDDSRFGDRHLPPAFDQQPSESAPIREAVGAVSVDENAVTVHVRPGLAAGSTAVVTTSPPGYVAVENSVVTTEVGPPSIAVAVHADAAGRERARVTGTVGLTTAPSDHARRLDNPGLAAGYALRAVLEMTGVRVRGAVRVGAVSSQSATQLARHESSPLSALLYSVGKDSNNFAAEMTVLAIAAAGPVGDPAPSVSFERGTERMVAWARGVGVTTEGLLVRNGSGLFDSNRFTARQLAQILSASWRDPAIRDEYVSQLAVAGDDGTLRARLRAGSARRRVRAKTGTLDDVVALSGYVLTNDPGRALIFSVLCNGVRGRTAEARALADSIVSALIRREPS